MPCIVGILLAAGQSTRFGKENKLLAPLPDGTPLVIAAARPLLATLPRVIAIIPPNAPALCKLLVQHGLEIAPCAESSRGMGASIACGVRASADADGWLIGLGDMPCVSSSLVREIVVALDSGASLVRPVHAGRVGHPVGFSHRFQNELLQLENDRGGQNILKRHATSLQIIHTENTGIHRDIDTQSDLLSL